MQIIKYKYLKDGFYEVILSDKTLVLHQDCITRNEILLKKELSDTEILKLEQEENYYKLKKEALDILKKKVLTTKELTDTLQKSTNNQTDLENLITDLTKQGYIDDDKYAALYIDNNMRIRNKGPLYLKEELLKKGVALEFITKNLSIYTASIEEEKINKYVTKKMQQNKNKSNYYLKEKLKSELQQLGYHSDKIASILDNNNVDDREIRAKEEARIRMKLAKKYNGKELEYKIKQKMYQKGFKINN